MTLAEDAAYMERSLAVVRAERNTLADALVKRGEEITRLTRERDAAMVGLVVAADALHNVGAHVPADRARATITAIETGAINANA